MARWTPEYLKAQCGHRCVRVSVASGTTFHGDPKRGFAGRQQNMRFSSFIDRVSSGTVEGSHRYYLQQEPIHVEFPELVPDVRRPNLFPDSRIAAENLWIGGGGCISPLHYDPSENLLAQIVGHKRIILFPPDDLANVYPYGAMTKIPHLSRVNPTHPDFSKFPRFARTRRIECVLHPGEMLFIPFCWWHQVESVDFTVSVNFWWNVPILRRATHSWFRLVWSSLFR